MENYTKGEWKAGKSKESGLWHIHGGVSNGEYVCCLPDRGRAEANAHLIASAPLGDELATAILAQDKDGLDRWDWIVKKAQEFKDKAGGK